jgi:hypothetical protein
LALSCSATAWSTPLVIVVKPHRIAIHTLSVDFYLINIITHLQLFIIKGHPIIIKEIR